MLLDITGHIDGCALLYGGQIVAVFATLTGAARARPVAQEALDMLERTLAREVRT